MVPQQRRPGYLSPFEIQGAPVPLCQRQSSPSRNSGRMNMLSVPERRPGASSTESITSIYREAVAYNATNRDDPLEMLFCITDAILIITALIVVISLLVTFTTVGIATYRIVFGHVGERPPDIHQVLQHIHNAVNVTSEDFNFLNRLITNKKH